MNAAREDLLEELTRRAPYYVPEWRYDPSSPDGGAALVLLWADMFSGTLARFGRLPDNYRRALLDVIGSDPMPPRASDGVLVFTPNPGANGAVTVPAGTGVAAKDCSDAVMATDRELAVSPVKIDEIYYASPARDAVRRYEGLKNLTLFQAEDAGAHIWTLSHPYAFDTARSAALCLELRLQGGSSALLYENAAWEFLDGGMWRPLTVRPEGGGLSLTYPENRGSPCRSLRFQLDGEAFDGVILCGVSARPSGIALFADAVCTETDEMQRPDADFYPFGRRFLPGYCFSVSCRDAFGKPGASIEMSFDLRFEDFPIEGYPEPQIHWKKMMKAAELAPPAEYEVTAARVTWEYFNGVGWASLTVADGQADEMFAGGQTGSRVIRFTCPADMAPVICGAEEALFIRARLLAADNLFRMRGHYKTPVVGNLRFRYAFPGGIPITEAEATEHLDTKSVSFNRPVRLAERPPAPAAVYFASEQPFTQGTLLFILEPGTPPPALRWEYAAPEGWAPLDIFDGTGGLSKTGILTYQSPGDGIRRTLFGRDAYWLRLVDAEGAFEQGERGTRPGMRLLRLYENAVTASARTPGEASNLPAAAFSSLTLTLPGISGVFNPLPGSGGTDGEPEDGIIRRLTAAFFHQDRAISAPDYESLALEASPQVYRARCYPGVGPDGKSERGSVCLALLRRSGTEGDFEPLRQEVRAYLEARRPLGAGALYIVEPRTAAVNITLHAGISDPGAALSVKRFILETLARYLDPVAGGPGHDGWPIGGLPAPDTIAALVRTLPGIRWISGLKASYTRNAVPSDYAAAADEPFILPVNGTHEIVLTG